ncbi:mRNA decapping enzyme [Coprinopsis sp. MPI-PUGE-AT-0042]|nr:mRNA decapping enzyme [Coprinopsis sp. MPI-PUGE-AT-0042]
MSHPSAPQTLQDLKAFDFQRILNEDPISHSLTILGSLGGSQAIVRIEKAPLDATAAPSFLRKDDGLIERVNLEQSTDIYTWFFGWLGENRPRDVKINVICPATETHVRKYSKQEYIMVHETPEVYEAAVKPYIAAFPPARTKWVDNILSGVSEQSKVLFSNASFLILPDMKWDLTTVSALYLMALVKDGSIRSLRDLRGEHIPILKGIRDEADRIVKEKWQLKPGSLRCYIHYQPSYYHFHVHIVNVNYQGGMLGMTVGQAHLLDDIISLLEIDPDIFQKMTLSYGLGDQHELLGRIQEAAVQT